jgi:hypothetical protein
LYWHNYWIIFWIVIVNVEFTLVLVIEYFGMIVNFTLLLHDLCLIFSINFNCKSTIFFWFIEYILLLYWHNYWIICWIVILNVEFTLGLVIISIDWVNWSWLLLICAGLWIWVVSSIGQVLSIFLTFEFNYIIICIKLCRWVEWKAELVAHVRSQLVHLAAMMIFS